MHDDRAPDTTGPQSDSQAGNAPLEADNWYGPDAATFGDRLAAAREAAGMSQNDLARRLGIKLKSLQGWEQDLAEPRANKLATMAGLLNVSMGWLISGEGEGLGPPADHVAPDIETLVLDLRALRADMRAASDRAARIEKRLRHFARAEPL